MRNTEIVIDDFEHKSKAGAIVMVQKILEGIDGNPQIVSDRTSNVPKVVPVTFVDHGSAKRFLDAHGKSCGDFHGQFKSFWCNWSQTEDERREYGEKYRHLFKIKRAIIEITVVEADNIVVNKNESKVYVISGHDLHLVATATYKASITWESSVEEKIKIRAVELLE